MTRQGYRGPISTLSKAQALVGSNATIAIRCRRSLPTALWGALASGFATVVLTSWMARSRI